MDKLKAIVPAVSFYDVIAEEYNNHMSEGDLEIRQIVSQVFAQYVSSGSVLDFGGGTGLDLPWLLANENYQVFFLEPAVNMRSKAKQSLLNSPNGWNSIFVEKLTNIDDWTSESLPFDEKLDGILANFAVLNCIKDINVLFEKLALLCSPGAHIVATVLDTRPNVIFKHYPIKVALSNLFKKKTIIYPNHDQVNHETYLHSLKYLKSASSRYFNYISYIPLKSSHFALLILSRK